MGIDGSTGRPGHVWACPAGNYTPMSDRNAAATPTAAEGGGNQPSPHTKHRKTGKLKTTERVEVGATVHASQDATRGPARLPHRQV